MFGSVVDGEEKLKMKLESQYVCACVCLCVCVCALSEGLCFTVCLCVCLWVWVNMCGCWTLTKVNIKPPKVLMHSNTYHTHAITLSYLPKHISHDTDTHTYTYTHTHMHTSTTTHTHTHKHRLSFCLTVSMPSNTRRGIVVIPPLIHSSRVTVPSLSKSISSIIS